MQTNAEKILVVEDDPDVQELISSNLRRGGYAVEEVTSGAFAMAAIRSFQPDLVVLDRMLPDKDGIQICREMKIDPRVRQVPVVMVTARSAEADIIMGLQAGADDYVTKPFRPRELLARISSVLRRSGSYPGRPRDAILIRELAIDPAGREARVCGERVDLSHIEFDVLLFLARHRLNVLYDGHE